MSGTGAKEATGTAPWRRWLGGLLALAATTLVLYLARAVLRDVHVALVYLLVVLGGSAVGGRTLGIPLAVASFLAFNFLFVPPHHTFGVEDPRDWIVLLAFLATGIVAAELLARAQSQATIARERAERVAALHEADRIKDALLASVSHDIRTPLTTIRGLAHEMGAGGDERALVIEEEVDRLDRFVADLLDLSRLQAGGMPAAVALNAAEDVMGAALQRVAGVAAGRDIRASLDPSAPVLVGRFDFAQTLRILVNLLENALKYSPPAMPVDFTVRREQGELAFAVADRGPGVAERDRERIFAPFYRPSGSPADSGGAGLGLAIARGLAEAQGGTLTHQPREGGGSVFTLRLQAAELGDALLAKGEA